MIRHSGCPPPYGWCSSFRATPTIRYDLDDAPEVNCRLSQRCDPIGIAGQRHHSGRPPPYPAAARTFIIQADPHHTQQRRVPSSFRPTPTIPSGSAYLHHLPRNAAELNATQRGRIKRNATRQNQTQRNAAELNATQRGRIGNDSAAFDAAQEQKTKNKNTRNSPNRIGQALRVLAQKNAFFVIRLASVAETMHTDQNALQFCRVTIHNSR